MIKKSYKLYKLEIPPFTRRHLQSITSQKIARIPIKIFPNAVRAQGHTAIVLTFIARFATDNPF